MSEINVRSAEDTGTQGIALNFKMLPMSSFSIPLGLAGLGGGWSAGRTYLGAPAWPEEILFGISSVFWLVFAGTYLTQAVRHQGALAADLRHPEAGPFASFVPLAGVLISTHYIEYVPAAGWVCVLMISCLAVVAIRLFAHWLTGGVRITSIHPGYFIPGVAGSFVASVAFSKLKLTDPAVAAFGVGMFFWLVIGAVVTSRLMSAEELQPAAKPGLSAYLAAPATASIAWIVLHPGPPGALQTGLTGVVVVMVLLQVILLSEYRKLKFTPLFWIFTFPIASTTNYAVRWLAESTVPGWEFLAWAVLSLATALVLVIGTCTILQRVSLARGAVVHAGQ